MGKLICVFGAAVSVAAFVSLLLFSSTPTLPQVQPVERVVERTRTVTQVQYSPKLQDLLAEVGYDYFVVTYAEICGGETAVGARSTVNVVAVADRRLLGCVFWVENAPDWLPKTWVAVDCMPGHIGGKPTCVNRLDKYMWGIPKHGRDKFRITGVRTIKDMQVIVLNYEGPTREQLGH